MLAVGVVRDFGAADSAGGGPALAHMLATSLASEPRVRVIGWARVYELSAGRGEASVPAAARGAGARYLLEGELHRSGGGRQRLEARIVDLRTGVVVGSYGVEGAGLFALADGAARETLESFGMRPDRAAPPAVSTRSAVAYQLYEEGLRAFYGNDFPGARRLFAAALDHDSTFAMAAYHTALAHRSDPGPKRLHLTRALRLSAHATDRERLLIRAAWASTVDDPSRLAIADTLVSRYPQEPDGHLLLGEALMWDGSFMAAIPHVRRVLDTEPAPGLNPARCPSCDAYWIASRAYQNADSLAAAERIAREWVARQPESVSAHDALMVALERQGRFAEADSVRATLLRIHPDADPELWSLAPLIRRGDFEGANRVVARALRTHPAEARGQLLWYHTMSLRAQGRLREALAAARALRLGKEAPLPYSETLHEAQVLFELGRFRQAAALWDSLASAAGPVPPTARHRAWALTHAGAARAALGDSAAVRRIADTVQILGAQSAYGRDRRLHHHLRAYLLLMRGHSREAESRLRQAIFSPSEGYVRTHLELGRLLLREGRPRDAAAVLEPSLRGSLEASNLYVSRTELHLALADAYAAAGDRARALAHYRWVDNAWRRADPPLHPLRDRVRQRIASLNGGSHAEAQRR